MEMKPTLIVNGPSHILGDIVTTDQMQVENLDQIKEK